MGRGGSRPGAGRKRRAQTHERAINAAVKRCADRLPQLLDNMERLADGGFPITEEVFEPAGTVVIDGFEVITDDKGNEKVAKVRKLAFPDEDPDTLVLVRRTVRDATPDRSANEYLINRVMGTPTSKHEFSGLSDAELHEEAARLFGRDAELHEEAARLFGRDAEEGAEAPESE